jgi:hypothetical protein
MNRSDGCSPNPNIHLQIDVTVNARFTLQQHYRAENLQVKIACTKFKIQQAMAAYLRLSLPVDLCRVRLMLCFIRI